jgi:uncharacterized protein YtpQ (UPF0354 family)
VRHGWRGLLLGALLCSQLAFAALSKDAFAQEYVSVLRAALPGYTVEIAGPMEVTVTDSKGEKNTVYLDNAYSLYVSDPDSRQELIEQRVAAFVESVNMQDELKAENIVPIVKDRGWLDEIGRATQARSSNKPVEQVFEPLNELLVVVYAEDTPRNIRYFSAENLEKAGVKRDSLRALAVKNLRRVLPEIEIHSGPLISMVTAGGNYEASLLLFEDFWKGDRLKVDGDYVVAVPTRDLLLVTGSKNAEGVAQLREMAKSIVEESTYTLTDQLFVYRNGRFVPFR